MYPNQIQGWQQPTTMQSPIINPQQMQQLKMAFQVLQNSQNPGQMIQTMLMQNPKLKNIMNLVQGGQSPRDLFAQYTGIDPDAFLKALQQQ